MKVFVACEESQRVCIAFRERGHEAYSCDIQDCSGGRPEWHIKGDALKCLQGGQMYTSMFAESEEDAENYVTKATCLWLVNLPKLKGNGLPKPDNGKLFGKHPSGKNRTWEDTYSRSAKVRSKTFPGIAEAMAEQWGAL